MKKTLTFLCLPIVFAVHTASAKIASVHTMILFTNPSSDAMVSDLHAQSAHAPTREHGDRSAICEFDCLDGSGNVQRNQITFAQLQNSKTSSMQNYSHYAIPKQAANPKNLFSGSLILTIEDGHLTEQGTTVAHSYRKPNRLPKFSFEFIQHGSHFIPLQRQLIKGEHPSWEYLLLPGRVWQENSDFGFSRVALPFALQEVNANCTHNGVMMFVFKNDGTISDVQYQIAQETCQYFKFNLHGKLKAKYSARKFEQEFEIKRTYIEEVKSRLPVKPLEALQTDHPSTDLITTNIGSDQTRDQLSAYGIYYKGIHYMGDCTTRHGNYPYCEVMALPSFSIAKTVVAGLGLMRLEQMYSGEQRTLAVRDYVPECSFAHWQDVSLEQTLNMATGNYDSAKAMIDEGAPDTVQQFFLSGSHQSKIRHACKYPRKAKPGTRFVYHSSDSYILGWALQQFYRKKTRADADFYRDILVNDLWRPLKLSPLSYQSKRTYDQQNQPFAGYGLTLFSDDFVKLGRFISEQKGTIDGQQLLNPQMLFAAINQHDNDKVDTGAKHSRYRNGIWSYNLKDSNLLNCKTNTWLPYMSGYGGIGVVLLPNGMVYYYISDNSEYGFTRTIKELNKIQTVCH